MNKLSKITLEIIEHIADVKNALFWLENGILSESGIGFSLPDFEEKAALLSMTARLYQITLRSIENKSY